MLEKISLEDFEPRVGETFTMEVPGNAITTVLVAARAGMALPEGVSIRQPFSLLFRAAPELRISSGAVTLKAEDGLTLHNIAITPVAVPDLAGEPGTYIEVIFN